jgi:tetratricopeptide (TPR) repeat protein
LRVILVGHVDEPTLIRKLGEKVQAIAPPPLANGRAVMDVLQDSSLPFLARMEQIVRHPATSKLLLVFDDFEANVERIAPEGVTYRQAAIDVVTVCAAAIRSTSSSSRVILTSWHGVPLHGPGWKLEPEHLEPLSLEDQEKTIVHLPALRERRDEDVAVEAIRLAGGNPRLLEYFNRCLADGNTDPAALLEAIRNAPPDHRLDRFVERLVSMIETQQPGFENALSRLAIVELPVARAVALATIDMGSLGNDLLDRGAALGLVEAAIAVEDRQPRYLVPPIVRALVSEPDATAASRAADAIIRLSWRGDTDSRLLELIRLARQGSRVSLAADAMGVLATRWLTKDRFRDACTLCRDMPAGHGDFKLSIAAGRAEAAAGTATKAGEHFAHAWQLTDKAAVAVGSLDDRDLANAEAWYSEWLMLQGNNDDAEPVVRRAAERFKQLGDVRERAVTLGKIADIYQARGDLDGAMKILKEEQLPVFEKLGDVRSRAVTLGQIADIYQARGDLDRALKIRKEEQLPVYEKLGDVRELLVARANIALTMLARNRKDDVPEIVSLLVWSYRTAAERGFAEAGQLEQILRKLGIDSR